MADLVLQVTDLKKQQQQQLSSRLRIEINQEPAQIKIQSNRLHRFKQKTQ